jgi:hypothetical protein
MTIELNLTPTAPGNFTAAHGLSQEPYSVRIEMTSGGNIWFQKNGDGSLKKDATNLYLVASAADITARAFLNAVDAPAGGPYSITLQATINWARTHTDLTPIVGVGGFSNEPALTICNAVIQEMLSFPYPWPFNRKSAATFDTALATQEYTLTGVLDIGWLERAQREEKASTAVPKPTYDLECVRALPKDFLIDNPYKIAKDRESDGNTIVRVWPVPGNVIWTVSIDYQIKPVLKTLLTETWSPIPDELAFIYEQGVLAFALKAAKDRSYIEELKLFYAKISRGLGLKDANQQHEGFFPERSIMLG